MLDDGAEVTGEVRADRRGPHATAVAARALAAEHRARGHLVGRAFADRGQHAVRATAVAAGGLVPVALCEPLREHLGPDAVVRAQHLDDRQRHRRVVGPHPRAPDGRRARAESEHACRGPGMEQLFPECIADRKAFECHQRALDHH